jgi:hypothetical protein
MIFRDALSRPMRIGDVVTWARMSGHRNDVLTGVVVKFNAESVGVRVLNRLWRDYTPIHTIKRPENLTITGLDERSATWLLGGEG